MYHLPLLPGYGPNSNVRSSAPPNPKAVLSLFYEAEENGYQGTYFAPQEENPRVDGYVTSASVECLQHDLSRSNESQPDTKVAHRKEHCAQEEQTEEAMLPERISEDRVAEVVFFAYGVVVFYGLSESHERSILEDLANADILKRCLKEDDWEIEQCHFMVNTLQSLIHLS